MAAPFQNRRTIEDTKHLIESAATACATAGGDDPKDGYVYGLPETDDPGDDITMAVQLLRRAQNRLESWSQDDLRALAAEMVYRHGVGFADSDTVEGHIAVVAEEEFPDSNQMYPVHFDEVRHLMRCAVVEIDGHRYGDEPEHKLCPDYLVNPDQTIRQVEEVLAGPSPVESKYEADGSAS